MPFAVRLDKGAHLFGSALWPCRFGFRGRGGAAAALWRVGSERQQCERKPIQALENSSAGTISRSAGGSPSVVASSALFFSAGVATRPNWPPRGVDAPVQLRPAEPGTASLQPPRPASLRAAASAAANAELAAS